MTQEDLSGNGCLREKEKTAPPYTLLTPGNHPAREDRIHLFPEPPEDLTLLYPWVKSVEPIALDLETTGNKSYLASCHPVAVAMANSYGSCSVDFRGRPEFLDWLLVILFQSQTPIFCHNLFFDGSVLMRLLNTREDGSLPEWYHEWRWFNFVDCTYAKSRHLATEGWIGQMWGLKPLASQLLGWKETQDKAQKRWMVENGITKKRPKKALLEKLGINQGEEEDAEEQQSDSEQDGD